MIARASVTVVGVVVTFVVGLGAAPALGYFTSLGTGTAPGAAGQLDPLVIHAATTGTVSTPLTPGRTGDLILRVANPNATAVRIVRVAPGGSVVVEGGQGCTSGNSGVSVLATGLNLSVAGGATQTITVPQAASMTTASASGCQGATFRVPVTVEVNQ